MVSRMISTLWHQLLDMLMPRLCVACGRRLGWSEQTLCASCLMHLSRTGFQHSPLDNKMARLFWGVVPVERAAALFYYEAHSKTSQIIYDLKYHDRPDIGVMMGRLAAREFEASGFFSGIDLIVPMPLARNRQRQRGYNQSRQLAEGLSRATGIPLCSRAVSRSVFRKSQTTMGRWDRQANVEGVFALADADALRGRHVLLVDDVVTTGATMTACARELLKAGDVTISLFALGFAKS